MVFTDKTRIGLRLVWSDSERRGLFLECFLRFSCYRDHVVLVDVCRRWHCDCVSEEAQGSSAHQERALADLAQAQRKAQHTRARCAKRYVCRAARSGMCVFLCSRHKYTN